jgi:antitoxin (DNA-binding transcriptional repressor) of toxin-antitoxin stability system
MDTMTVSGFKTTCLAAVERVRQTRRPLLLTKRGVPIAQVIPAPSTGSRQGSFGALAGTLIETGDIVEPVAAGDWEGLR